MMKTSSGAVLCLAMMLQAGTILCAETVEHSFNAPTGIVFAKDGACLVSEWGAGSIALVRDGKKATLLGGLSNPAGLAFDDNGNLYIAGYGDGNIYKWNGKGKPQVIAEGFSAPTGLLWDDGLLVANRNCGEVVKIDSAGNKTIVSSGHKLPVGLARTADGQLFVSCYGGSVDVIARDGKKKSFVGILATPGVGIVPGGKDSVYVVDYAGGKIALADASGKSKFVADNLSSPVALAKNPDGNLVVGCWGDSSLHNVMVRGE